MCSATAKGFAVDQTPFTCQGVVAGLTVGAPYWIDIGLAAGATGTAAAVGNTISTMEF